MEHTSKDLRVRRTLKAIRSAFYELVLTKNYSDISITELTDLAEINRKTFYLHYSSLDDLVKEVEQEIVDHILQNVRMSAEQMDVAGCVDNFITIWMNVMRYSRNSSVIPIIISSMRMSQMLC